MSGLVSFQGNFGRTGESLSVCWQMYMIKLLRFLCRFQETHVGDSPVELKGLPSPPAALYHGPAFPPQPHRSTPLTEPVLNNILQRETLENRLVDW